MTMKNSNKNDGGIRKTTAIEKYEETFDMQIKQKRLGAHRRAYLLEKIRQISENNIREFTEVDHLIDFQKSETGEGTVLVGDFVVIAIQDCPDMPTTHFDCSYSTCVLTVKNPNMAQE